MRPFAPLMLLALLAAAPATTSRPATQPTRLDQMEALMDGTLRYVPPPQWKLARKDDLSAVYESNDAHAMIAITVTPQTYTLQDASKNQMSMIIGKGIREGAAKNSQQLVYPPRVEPDDRFFLKMHDAMSGGGMIADRIQMYRIIGLNLVHVVASVQVNDMEESKDVFEIAEGLLHQMQLTRGAKRVVYPKAQLRAVVPLDWKEAKRDDPNGLVATFTDPKDSTQQILLSARIIPKAIRDDDIRLKAFVDKMIDQERSLPSRIAMQKTDEKTLEGTKYLRHMRYTLTGDLAAKDAGPQRVETRYLIVGDVLVSVRSVAKEANADAVAALAEKLADGLKPIREPVPAKE